MLFPSSGGIMILMIVCRIPQSSVQFSFSLFVLFSHAASGCGVGTAISGLAMWDAF